MRSEDGRRGGASRSRLSKSPFRGWGRRASSMDPPGARPGLPPGPWGPLRVSRLGHPRAKKGAGRQEASTYRVWGAERAVCAAGSARGKPWGYRPPSSRRRALGPNTQRGAGLASPASRCPAPPRPARPRRPQASVAPQDASPATLAKTFGSRRVGSGPAPSRVRSASEPGTESSTFLRQEAAVAKRKATPETLSAERSDKTLPTGPNNSFKYIPNLNRFLLAC